MRSARKQIWSHGSKSGSPTTKTSGQAGHGGGHVLLQSRLAGATLSDKILEVEPYHAMNILYGNSEGRADVSCDTPVSASLDTALAVFRGLDPRSGFMGIVLDERFVLQMSHRKHERVHIELLNTSIPAFDACEAELEFAESLIRAAADGEDVFRIARASDYEWEHLDMA